MANSRPLVRSATLLTSLLSGDRGRLGATQLAAKMSHFNGSEPRFEPLVAPFQPGAIDGLLCGVAGEHTKNDWHTGIHLCELQAAGGFCANVVVVRSLAADHTA